MANTIKLKRGSGSDPSASDLVVGELAIRTDTGKIFLKKDNGNVAEVSGGGGVSDGDKGDITVSNSGDTFTIDNDAVTTAKIADNAIVASSINSDSVTTAKVADGAITDVKLANNSVALSKIPDGTITNAKINASAAIDGSKISPTFTSDLTVEHSGHPTILLHDTSGDNQCRIRFQTDTYSWSAGLHGGEDRWKVSKSDTFGTNDYLEIDNGGSLHISNNIVVGGTVDGRDLSVDGSKLDGIETGATADQTASDIKTLLQSNKLTASEIANDTITATQLAAGAADVNVVLDGAIVNSKVNASAAIAGSKITPDFGSQNIATTGTTTTSKVSINSTTPILEFNESDGNPDYRIFSESGAYTIQNLLSGTYTTVFKINSDGHTDIVGNLDCGAGIDVTGNIDITDGTLIIDTTPNSPNTDYGLQEAIRIDDGGQTSDRGLNIYEYRQGGARFFSLNFNLASGSTGSAYTYTQGNYGGSTMLTFGNNGDFRFHVNSEVTGGSTDVITPTERFLINTAGVTVAGNISVSGTVDGVDISTRDTLFGTLTDTAHTLKSSVRCTTLASSDNSTRLASTAFVQTAIALLVDSSPDALNTLNELAAALGDDANFSTTVTNSIATKLPLAGGSLTGNLSLGDNDITNVGVISLDKLQADNSTILLNMGTNKNISFAGNIGEIGSVAGFQAVNDAQSANTDFGIRATTIRLATGSAERLRVKDAGVDVTGALAVTGNISNSAGQITCGVHGTSGIQIINDGTFGTLHSVDLVLRTASTERARLDTNGNFELNNTNAAFKSISSSSGNFIRLYAGAGTGKWDIYGHGANLRFTDNNSAGKVVIDTELQSANFEIISANPSISFAENDQDPDFKILCNAGQFRLQNATASANLFTATATALTSVINHDFSAGIDVTGNITVTGTVDGRDIAADGSKLDTYAANGSSYVRSDQNDTMNGNYTITGSGDEKLVLNGGDPYIRFQESGTNKAFIQWHSDGYLRLQNQEDAATLHIKDNFVFSPDNSSFYTIWHSGNDGSGSGLDADTVDSIQASSFLRSDATDTASGAITFTSGSLQLSGHWYSGFHASTTNYIHFYPNGHSGSVTTTNLRAWNGTGSDVLQIVGGSATGLSWRGNTVWTAENDGSGSGLDADTLDNIQASSFARLDATNAFNCNGFSFNFNFDTAGRNSLVFTKNSSTKWQLVHTGSGDDLDWQKIGSGGSFKVEGNTVLTTASYDTHVCHLKTDVSTAMVEGVANEFTVNFNLEESNDTSAFSHSSGVVTVLAAGWYRVYANMVYENATSSARTTIRAYVEKNGTEIQSTRTYDYDRGASYGKFSNNKIETLLYLAANDTISIGNYAYNEDGSASIEAAECEFIVNSVSVATTTSNADTLDGEHGSYYRNASNINAGTLATARIPTLDQYIRSDANDTVTGNLTFSSVTAPITTYSVKFVNSEMSTSYYTDATGVLAFDENFYDDTEYGTEATAPAQTFTSNGGGLVIKNEDGWGAVLSSQNIQYCEGNFANLKINSNQVFHAGNDGSGSGLDADTVDGLEASVLVKGNGTNNGVTEINVSDADFIVEDTTDGTTNFIWRDHSAGKLYLGTDAAVVHVRSNIGASADSSFDIGSSATRFANIYGDQLYGAGSNITSLNASNLGSGTIPAARLSASDLLTLIKTVDGAGSGLDSDTVDGIAATSFLRSNANNDSASGTFRTSASYIEAGKGSGSVALTINDGYGNANIAFNHLAGIPDANGSSCRIETSVDNSTGFFMFEIGNNVTANGSAVTLTNTLYFTTSDITFLGNTMWHAGNDGSGSGLDADTLDGSHASSFVIASAITSSLLPSTTNSIDLGSSSKRWSNLYVNDMHFSNEGKTNDVDGSWGDWTLQEGENDIFMINNRSGKKFKIAMIPV